MRYAPEAITGYHGCSQEAATRILAGEAFVPSNNAYDWLGRGVYFWEYAPARADEWAKLCFGEDAAVLEATLQLGNCLHLPDTRHLPLVRQTYQALIEDLDRAGVTPPRNTERGAHFLDRWVIDRFCLFSEQTEDVIPFQTVHGCFPEGEPLYTGSKILSRANVQIAVRDLRCISSTHPLTPIQSKESGRMTDG